MKNEEIKFLKEVNLLLANQIEIKEHVYNRLLHEKLTYEDKQRGQHLHNNAVLDLYYKIIRNLKNSVGSPYFGRFDFITENHDDHNKYYIGKTMIADSDNNIVVLDWRAPISSVYYDSSLGKTSYLSPQGTIYGNITLKRQYIIQKGILKNILDVDIVSQDKILQEYLNINATNRMKDIVASIQKEQNAIIRYPNTKNLITQGVAGSGKTSVALHRVAYLMYNLNVDRNIPIDPNQFMIIGPNNFFLDYISNVLPDLEVDFIQQTTFNNLMINSIDKKLKVDNNLEMTNYLFEKEIIKDFNIIMERIIINYVEELKDQLNNSNILAGEKVLIPKEKLQPYFTSKKTKVLDAIKIAEKVFINRIKNDYKDERYRLESIVLDSYLLKNHKETDLFSITQKLRNDYSKGFPQIIKNHFKPFNKTTIQHMITILSNVEKYTDSKFVHLYKEDFIKRLRKKIIMKNDLSLLAYLNELLQTNDKYKEVVQLVVDEAQDYNLMDYKVLKSMFPNAKFSIFGDLNQSILSQASIDKWEDIRQCVFDEDVEIFYLNKSYRSTEEIMSEANKISEHLTNSKSDELVRHGEVVDYLKTGVNFTDTLKDVIYEYINKGYHSIAIITKDEKEATILNESLQDIGLNINKLESSDTTFKGGLCVASVSLVKGLEFDATILINVDEANYNQESNIDMRLLYVAMTRALHKTTILYKENLPKLLKTKKPIQNKL